MDRVFELEQRILGENSKLLGDASLSHLRKYKYSGVDRSILSKYVLNPFWTWCVGLMPMWLAPNCITLIGISSILLCNFFVLVYQGGDLTSPMPRAVYLFTAFSFFFYQTMDNIDGKQARRTGMSSPLGELFDHGIDSLNCLWGALLMISTLSEGSGWAGVANLLAPTVGMFFSTWETYYTKTLFLDYLNAPTEGLIVAVMFHLTSGLFGPLTLVESKIYGTNLPLGTLWTIPLIFSVLVLHIPSCIRNVRRLDPNSFAAGPLTSLWPLALLVTSILAWCAGPNSIILNSDVSQGHLYLFGWALSFTFGRMTTTIILSHLCHQRFPKLSFPLVLLSAGALFYGFLPTLGLNVTLLSELSYLRVYFALSALYFFGFSSLVIDRLTHYLGIRAFTVRTF